MYQLSLHGQQFHLCIYSSHWDIASLQYFNQMKAYRHSKTLSNTTLKIEPALIFSCTMVPFYNMAPLRKFLESQGFEPTYMAMQWTELRSYYRIKLRQLKWNHLTWNQFDIRQTQLKEMKLSEKNWVEMKLTERKPNEMKWNQLI